MIALIAAAGVAAQPTILGSKVDQCTPTFTDAMTAQNILWVANGASSPGVDWITLEAEDAAPGQGIDRDLPAWLALPTIPVSALERRVG
ncbi:MAG: hypothetical protein ACK55I_24975, partial [bacterium]